MVRFLQRKKLNPIVLDDFSTGNEWATKDCEILETDLLNKKRLSQLLNGRKFDAIFHFAGKSLVEESYLNPKKYIENNFVGTKNLLEVSIKNENKIFIFSSTAAVYGKSFENEIIEDLPRRPINAYGKSKLLCELLMEKYSKSSNLTYAILRYFNVAGADAEGDLGEFRKHETHLVPSILNAIKKNNSEFTIYGNDYNTKDGTCVRDYVHVSDLVEAHFNSYLKIKDTRESITLNLASQNGFSVLDVLQACEKVSGIKVNFKIEKRRKGDVSKLVANCNKAKEVIGWKPKFSDIKTIIDSAWKWHNSDIYKKLL